MKQCYKNAGLLLIAASLFARVEAQTHYGIAVGTTGEGHVFLGTQAGAASVDAYNTFIGANSGQFHSTGAKSTFLGYKTGANNSTGMENTLIGAYSGNALTGEKNVFLGSNSGEAYKGNRSLLLGNLAGGKAAGNDNIFMGNGTGYQSTGNGNVLIGIMTASMFNIKSQNNTMIGNEAGAYTENSWENAFFGASSGRQNKTGNYNSFFGRGSGYNIVNGNYNSCFGYNAGSDDANGQSNTFIGAFTGTGVANNLTNATAIGSEALVMASNSIVLGKNANVGIGVSAPTYQLHLSTSSAAKLGSPSWTIWSDKRLKKDISDFTDGLDLLKQIKPVWFSYNGVAGTKSDKKFVGVIAQDMQKIAPYTIGSSVYQDSLGTKTEYLDYDANAVTYILINAVKEQQEIIDQKESRIRDLEERFEKLEKAVAAAGKGSSSGINLSNNGEQTIDDVVLEQNAPNSFSENTSIRYYIPHVIKTAQINVYSSEGMKVGTYPINDRGSSQLTLFANTLNSGLYLYDLITDGKSNGAKKMIITK